jgi:hypothetical protein
VKKNVLKLLLIICSLTAFACHQNEKKVRVAPKAGPGEKQLTCDEIDKIEPIPQVNNSTPFAKDLNKSLSESIDKINRDLQYKKDFCAGKIKHET